MRIKRSDDEAAIEAAIGVKIRIARRARDRTQAQLAAHIGVTMQQIQKYESGRSRVTAFRLIQISRALGFTICFFTDDLPVTITPMDD